MFKVLCLKDITYLNKKKKVIIDKFSIDINSEEIVEIYGEMLTGKTALLEIMHGVVKSDKGSIEKNGKTAMVFKDIVIYQDLTVMENFEFFREINGADIKKVEKIVETLGLVNWKNERTGTFPEGLKRVVQAGCAMISDFNILLLDEPFLDLDTTYQKKLEDKMKELKTEGKSIIYTTNNNSQSSYCDRRVNLKRT